MENLENKERPFLIGLTGPIGSGKSLVRKMLEHLGALTIDADQLAHQAYQPGRPGYDEVLKRFGGEILDKDGRVNRHALGRIVFQDAHNLKELESIVHPLVVIAVHNILAFSPMPIVAIEAIKLFESGLVNLCDAIWVIDAPQQVLVSRLRQSRGMNNGTIRERLKHQADFSTFRDERISVIVNDAGVISLWNAVQSQWEYLALRSSRFKQALGWVNQTYQSFYMPLIQLSEEAAHDFIGQFPNCEGLEETFKFLCTHFIWESVPHVSGRNIVVSAINNHVMRILSITKHFDQQLLGMLLKMMEDFATLHLCTRVEAPFYEQFKMLFNEIGYDTYTNSESMEMVEGFILKSGFIKKILPEINVFKDV